MATETRDDGSVGITEIRGRLRGYRDTVEEYWFEYLLFLPTLLFMVFLLWLPFLRGVVMSFHSWPFVGEPEFIGLENYRFLFSWDPFITSIRATAIFWLTTVLQLAVALAAALTLNRISRFQNLLAGSMLIPYTMPPVVTGSIWLYLLEPSIGPFWKITTALGLLEEAVFWDTMGWSAMTVVTLITAWTFWPFMFLIIMAGLQSIPEAHYETAKVYGASRWQTFRNITLPQIRSAILVAVSIRTIWNLAKVSQPLQLTRGGPGYETSFLGILLYRFAFFDGKLGLAYAVGMVLLVLTLGFVFIFLREFNKQRGEVKT